MGKNLTGLKFGRWLVERLDEETLDSKYRRWWCRCDCGPRKSVLELCLLRGSSTSCGCYQKERLGNQQRTHGMSRTPTFKTWMCMTRRCHQPTHHQYHHYGAQGITVCRRWRTSFANFFADMVVRPEGTTLDRIDGRKGYSKGNCRWATPLQQSNNARTNIRIRYKGKTKTLSEWATIAGVNYYTFWSRLQYGWSMEKSMTQPVRQRKIR